MGVINSAVTQDVVQTSLSVLQFIQFAFENPKELKALTKELADTVTITDDLAKAKDDAVILIAESKAGEAALKAKEVETDKAITDKLNAVMLASNGLEAEKARFSKEKAMSEEGLAVREAKLAQDIADLGAKQATLVAQAEALAAKLVEAQKVLDEKDSFEKAKAKFEVIIGQRTEELDARDAVLSDREAKLRQLLG